MKVKKVLDICKKEHVVRIYTTPDGQKIGCNYATYNIEGLPTFDEETLCSTYDIDFNARKKILFQELPAPLLNMKDIDESDRELNPIGFDISIGDSRYIILDSAKDGAIVLNSKYLAPFLADKDDFQLYLRGAGKLKYIVVKVGLFLKAVIFPSNNDLINDKFMDELNSMAALCVETYYRNSESEDEENQISMEEIEK